MEVGRFVPDVSMSDLLFTAIVRWVEMGKADFEFFSCLPLYPTLDAYGTIRARILHFIASRPTSGLALTTEKRRLACLNFRVLKPITENGDEMIGFKVTYHHA